MEFLLTAAIFIYMYACAMACSRIAAHKGRGADEWFVCGELLGVFAVVTLLVLPSLRHTRERPNAS